MNGDAEDQVSPCPDGTFDVTFLYTDRRPHCVPIIIPQTELDAQAIFGQQARAQQQVQLVPDPLGNIAFATCEDDEEQTLGSSSTNVPPPNVPPDAPDKLRRVAEKYQRSLYRQRIDPSTGLTLKRPETASVAVNRLTGEVVWTAHSAKFNPDFEAKLTEEFGEPRTAGNWTQCAEARGCYIDAQGKATVDLDIFTWDVKSGEPLGRCPNCQVSVNLPGQQVYSDRPYPSYSPRDLRGRSRGGG